MAEDAPAAPPGWYPDPKMADTRRYWNGESWSEHVAPAPPAVTYVATVPGGVSPGLEAAGWLTAIAMPLVGFIIGLVVVGKPAPNRGGWIIALSIICGFGWFLVLGEQSQY
jgi:hypothetical protein